MILFMALVFVGVAIGGTCAFVIFWPLSLVHLREREPAVRARLGENAFLRPAALRWLLSGGYREVADRQFTGLATPARIALVVTMIGLVFAGLLALWALS
ncbi:hypothetical protein E5843_08225 [Luteimonas yindakuii]|uniref:hypothetical protein n=1 Tax=Luteimonas yindakuii TaxID=2565782 RepID=UPI0010A39C9A|nr:hypothetical protein [Luteimonas yindakuii]QCO67758.1 hypothetical protein E5843_08225 [Luteimonas yindakuii]